MRRKSAYELVEQKISEKGQQMGKEGRGSEALLGLEKEVTHAPFVG